MGSRGYQLLTYRRLLGAKVRSDWQYRTSFLVLLASQTLIAMTELATVFIIFSQVDALAGWTLWEVALLHSLGGVAFGLADMFASQAELLSRHVREGTFDRFLLRPMAPFLGLSAEEFALRRLGRFIEPVVVLVIALGKVGVDWTPDRVLLVPFSVVSGAVIFGSIWVVTSSISFWTVEAREFGNAFTYGGRYLTEYPLDVFGSALRRLVTFVIPIAFVAYLPAARLLDKPVLDGIPPVLAYTTPLAAIASFLVARSAWNAGIRHYCSTGS